MERRRVPHPSPAAPCKRDLSSGARTREVPHELAVHLTLRALRLYDARLHWRTTRMPDGLRAWA